MPDNLSSASITAANGAVMSVSAHESVVARLQAEISLLEADVENTWHTHQVFFVVGIAVVATALFCHFI